MNSEQTWRYSTLGILLTALAHLIVVQMLRINLSPEAKYCENRVQYIPVNGG
jgi:hypothetical protein